MVDALIPRKAEASYALRDVLESSVQYGDVLCAAVRYALLRYNRNMPFKC